MEEEGSLGKFSSYERMRIIQDIIAIEKLRLKFGDEHVFHL